MVIQLIGALLSSLIAYAIAVNMAVNDTEKIYIKLNKFFKILFGFWVYDTNRFGLKSIVFQTGNIIGILVALVMILVRNNIDLAAKYQGSIFIATVVITGIVALFVNRY